MNKIYNLIVHYTGLENVGNQCFSKGHDYTDTKMLSRLLLLGMVSSCDVDLRSNRIFSLTNKCHLLLLYRYLAKVVIVGVHGCYIWVGQLIFSLFWQLEYYFGVPQNLEHRIGGSFLLRFRSNFQSLVCGISSNRGILSASRFN